MAPGKVTVNVFEAQKTKNIQRDGRRLYKALIQGYRGLDEKSKGEFLEFAAQVLDDIKNREEDTDGESEGQD